MTSYALVLVPLITLLLGGVIGYLLGVHQATLLDRIHKLEFFNYETPVEPEPEKPTVTMGSYNVHKPTRSPDEKRPVGVAGTKTPQRLDWENKQAIEKEVRGY